MKRFRLSTIMLLVVIAALCATVVVQQRRAAVREVELEKRVAMSELAVAEMAVMNRTIEKRATEIKNNKVRVSLMNETWSELQKLDKEWSAAIVKNDAHAIEQFMSDDWVIIGPEGNVIERSRFLEVIKSGDLTHESMESDDWHVRVYGDTALVTSEAKSKGKYKGQVFETHERSTSVYVRKEGRWQCVHTQLTPIAKRE
jgi:ketosteroid isomerase-like protein